VFGWTAEAFPGEMPYTVFKADGKPSCGMMSMPKEVPPGVPSHWTVYFAVESCAASYAKARSLGATSIVEPTDIPTVGRFAMLFDPQRASFALLQPMPR
jgi:predicted enzyme related to lactoylglutathione lyase